MGAWREGKRTMLLDSMLYESKCQDLVKHATWWDTRRKA